MIEGKAGLRVMITNSVCFFSTGIVGKLKIEAIYFKEQFNVKNTLGHTVCAV